MDAYFHPGFGTRWPFSIVYLFLGMGVKRSPKAISKNFGFVFRTLLRGQPVAPKESGATGI